MITTIATTLIVTRIVRKVTARVTGASSGPGGSVGGGSGSSDAGRAFGALPRRVGTDRRPRDDDARVDRQAAARRADDEPVETTRGRTTALLADPVVLRAVAGALEPLRREAPRHLAAEVHALLVQRHDALFHPGDDGRVLR